MMSNPKEVAIALSNSAKEKGVRFPKIWDDSKIVQSCGAVLVSLRIELQLKMVNIIIDDAQER